MKPMSRSPITHLVLLVTLLVHLFSGIGHAQVFAWCFGAEGEARLENNPQGRCDTEDSCSDENQGENQGTGLGNLDADHCGDCFDFPALSTSIHHASRFSPEADLASPLLAPALPVHWSSFFPLLEALPGFRPQPPPPQQPVLAILRTVVLRN